MLDVKSISLWRWCINITVTFLDIIHRPAFCLKHNKNINYCHIMPSCPPEHTSFAVDIFSWEYEVTGYCRMYYTACCK
jgi:hypothetical protein